MKRASLTIRITAERKKSYPIIFEPHTLLPLIRIIKKEFPAHTIAIITDTTVQKLYANRFLNELKRVQRERVFLFSFAAGERHKNQNTKTYLDTVLLNKHCGRDTLILALGGGVVGDMAGFVASTFQRGVPYIQIPTTLLAMADSSIGGKTGIDTTYGKNTIGTFWQPAAVIINTSYLKTLPQDHWKSGLMEMVKLCLAYDQTMLQPLQSFMGKRDESSLIKILTKSIQNKARVVERDEKEKNERMVLNFGHTIGHAIEKVSNYSILHGIAVGVGMLAEARISHSLGILPKKELEKIQSLLVLAGVDISILKNCKAHDIIEATKYDKKKQGGKPLYVLLSKIGTAYRKRRSWAHTVKEGMVKKVLTKLLCQETHSDNYFA